MVCLSTLASRRGRDMGRRAGWCRRIRTGSSYRPAGRRNRCLRTSWLTRRAASRPVRRSSGCSNEKQASEKDRPAFAGRPSVARAPAPGRKRAGSRVRSARRSFPCIRSTSAAASAPFQARAARSTGNMRCSSTCGSRARTEVRKLGYVGRGAEQRDRQIAIVSIDAQRVEKRLDRARRQARRRSAQPSTSRAARQRSAVSTLRRAR